MLRLSRSFSAGLVCDVTPHRSVVRAGRERIVSREARRVGDIVTWQVEPTIAQYTRDGVVEQRPPGSPGSGGASPSYGVCQATEKRVRSFSSF
jgi:hypothetical protein